MSTASEQWHTVTIRVPFATNSHADIARQAIEVDKELRPNEVKRMLTVEGNVLVATFDCITVRVARLSANSFFDNVHLVVRTIGEFGEKAERQ